VETPGRKERAQDQWLEHDLIAKVVSIFAGHALATLARPETKIITQSLLCQVPEARDYLLPIDFGKTTQAAQTSALTRRRSTA
jgi:hypothetical protein